MILKNTFKIMWRNFGTIIKSCLYKLLVLCIVLLAGYGVLYPLIERFVQEGFFVEFAKLFTDGFLAFNGDVIINTLQEMNNEFASIMNEHISFTWNLVALFVLLFVLLPVLLGLSKVAEYGVLYNKLSNNSNFDLTTCYFEHLKKGLSFRFFRLLFTIPISVIIIAVCYGISQLFNTSSGVIAGFCIMAVFLLMAISLFMTVFLIYEPNLLIKNNSPWKALVDSVKNVKKYGFAKVFFIILAVYFVAFLFNVLFAVFTYGITLIITIPITIQFSNVLRMVLSYDCLGMNYYLDDKYVCVTKKFKQKETIENMIDVI